MYDFRVFLNKWYYRSYKEMGIFFLVYNLWY